jgi:hypothetical protein
MLNNWDDLALGLSLKTLPQTRARAEGDKSSLLNDALFTAKLLQNF